jgi:hypothetical protein
MLTLLNYMGHRGFEYSDIRATRKIHTAVRRRITVHKNDVPLPLFLKINIICVKETCKLICDIL